MQLNPAKDFSWVSVVPACTACLVSCMNGEKHKFYFRGNFPIRLKGRHKSRNSKERQMLVLSRIRIDASQLKL